MQELAEVTAAMPMMAQRTMVVVTDLDSFRLDELRWSCPCVCWSSASRSGRSFCDG